MDVKCSDEWNNFLERIQSSEEDLKGNPEPEEQLRLWASYRGQTLTKTGIIFFRFLSEFFFFFSEPLFLQMMEVFCKCSNFMLTK